MNQKNQRIEPTFGSDTSSDNEHKSEPTSTKSPLISLSTKKIPQHSFVPPLKRNNVELDNLATFEEQVQDATSTETIKAEPKAPESEKIEPAAPLKNEGDVTQEVLQVPKVSVEEKLNPFERVVPNAPVVETPPAKPAKSRRVLLVLLLLLAIGGVIYMLKPSSPETVQEIEKLQAQQGQSLPLELRPLNEDEAKAAEQKAKEEALAKEQASTTEQTTSQSENGVATPTSGENTAQQASEQNSAVGNSSSSQANVVSEVYSPPHITTSVQTTNSSTSTTSANSPSVVFQPETNVKHSVKVHTQAVHKTAEKPAETKANSKAQNAKQLDNFIKTVEKGNTTPPASLASAAKSSNAEIVSNKVLTVPKGVSLMQVFRDNNLNISDVNAMSKANNILSHLFVGERLTVYLDKNNRVVEMVIASTGGKFIRQANGLYLYKR